MADIELRIERMEQLFDNLDPAPFHAKALDRNADAYLRESAGEHSARAPLSIVIHAPLALAARIDDIASAIHKHFALAHQQAERLHRRQRRIGRVALAGGAATLAGALLVRRWVANLGGSLGDVLAEGLLILAWVALWRPIESIGFDSWKSREERRMLATLARVPIRFFATDSAPLDEKAAAWLPESDC